MRCGALCGSAVGLGGGEADRLLPLLPLLELLLPLLDEDPEAPDEEVSDALFDGLPIASTGPLAPA